GLLHEEAEAALGSEAAEDEGIVDSGEVLASHGELGLAVGTPSVVALRVLWRGARVVMAAAASCRGIADGHALERTRRVRGQLQPLHRVDAPRRLRMERLGEAPRALREPVAEAFPRRRHLHEAQHAAP